MAPDHSQQPAAYRQLPTVLDSVRRALGRSKPLARPPVPPEIAEPITRLVHADIGLSELFQQTAAANKIEVEALRVEDLGKQLGAFLNAASCHRIALPDSKFLQQLQIETSLKRQGFETRRWDKMTLDELYEFDAGVTDVYCAVAESGSLVVRASAEHGRALSLVPPIHVAIVQPRDFVPDLLDLFEKLGQEGTAGGTVLVSGPSKTSDIEMNLVIGVHGPMRVKAFVLA
jgi:L-lactate dehydrogenase complex protein LldG